MCAFEPARLDTGTQEQKIHRTLLLTIYYNYEKIKSESASVGVKPYNPCYPPDKVN